MKKIFISQPMKGKTEEHIKEIRQNAINTLKFMYPNLINEYEIINTHFTDFNGNRLQFLGKSIMEGLAIADVAVFLDDWEKYDGCRCEHFIASQYKIHCLYIPRVLDVLEEINHENSVQ